MLCTFLTVVGPYCLGDPCLHFHNTSKIVEQEVVELSDENWNFFKGYDIGCCYFNSFVKMFTAAK